MRNPNAPQTTVTYKNCHTPFTWTVTMPEYLPRVGDEVDIGDDSFKVIRVIHKPEIYSIIVMMDSDFKK